MRSPVSVKIVWLLLLGTLVAGCRTAAPASPPDRRDAANGGFDVCCAEDGGAHDEDAGVSAWPDASSDAGALVDAPADDAFTPRVDTGPRGDAGSCRAVEGPLDVLFIGNSQIEFSELPQIVSDLAASAPAACPRVRSERFTRGGANLRDLWEVPLPDGRRLSTTIASGRYEVVVLAESIDLAELRPAPFPALFLEYATRIVAASRAAGALPILYATPYVASDRAGFAAMADPQLELGRGAGVGVAAGGLAWLRVWDEAPGIALYAADRAHPGYEGSYVSALVIWAAITGGDPIGLSHAMTIFCDGAPCPAISLAHAELFQRAAWSQHVATGPAY